MRAVVQRVARCTVSVDGDIIGQIGRGILVYLGVGSDDTRDDVAYLAGKIAGLRIIDDENGTMNLSVEESGGSIYVVSQFTLLADTRKGRRPSYTKAASPEYARELYELFINEIERRNIEVRHGAFGESMHVDYVNDGPVTILLDSKKLF